MRIVDAEWRMEHQCTQDGRLLAELEALPDDDLLRPLGELLAYAFDDLSVRIVEIRVREPARRCTEGPWSC